MGSRTWPGAYDVTPKKIFVHRFFKETSYGGPLRGYCITLIRSAGSSVTVSKGYMYTPNALGPRGR